MIKKITLSAFTLIAGYILADNCYTNRSKPPIARTSAPNEGSCAISGCHNTSGINSGSGDVSIRLVNSEASYVLDSSYVIEVKVTDATKSRFGFELTALDSNHNPAGSFVRTNTANTATGNGTVNGKSRKYITHMNAGANATWQFKWTAPAVPLGTVTFYGIGNAANGDGEDTNDLIYINTLEFKQDSNIVAAINPHGAALNCYFNAFDNTLSIKHSTIKSGASVRVYDLSGRMVLDAAISMDQNSISTASLNKGIYLVELINGKEIAAAKLFIGQN